MSKNGNKNQQHKQQQQEQKVDASAHVPDEVETVEETETETPTPALRENETNEQDKPSAPQAPAGMFENKEGDRAVDNVAVRIFKEQVDLYADKSGKGKGEGADVIQATTGLQLAIENMTAMRGATMRECLKYLCKKVRADKQRAFHFSYPLRFAHQIKGESKRVRYAMIIGLIQKYATLSNPSEIHEFKDIKAVAAKIADQRSREEFARFFQ